MLDRGARKAQRLLRDLRVLAVPSASHRFIARVRARGLTYVTAAGLNDLAKAVKDLEMRAIPGAVVEAGCALGGSAIVLAAAKRPERAMFVYDTFEGMPPPSDKDPPEVHERYRTIRDGQSPGIRGGRYYGYEPELYQKVRDSFARYGYPADQNSVHLIKGLFQDTMNIDWPVALAHLDCDWYESVMISLRKIEPKLVTGGRFVIDDYDIWGGCRRAVDEYFAGKSSFRFVQRAALHIVKTDTLYESNT